MKTEFNPIKRYPFTSERFRCPQCGELCYFQPYGVFPSVPTFECPKEHGFYESLRGMEWFSTIFDLEERFKKALRIRKWQWLGED